MSAAKRLVLSLAGRRGEGSSPAAASSAGSSTRLVDRAGSGSGPGGGPGTPAGSGVGAPGGSAGSDLEEIAIVSNASGGQVKYGSGNLSSNGPRLVPGIITTGGGRMGDRCSPVAHHKSSAESVPGLAGLGGFGGLGRSYGPYGPHAQARSVSRQSLLDLVGCRLGVGRNQRQHQVTNRYFSSSRDSLAASYVNRTATASELDLSRKARRRELRGRLKLPAAVTSMAGSGADARSMGGMAPHGPAMGSGTALLPLLPRGSVAHAGQGYGGIQHRGRGSAACGAAGTRGPGRPHPGPSWSFVFDPAGRLCYYWSVVVSLAFLYNFWVIIYRFAFAEINRETIVIWFCLDYLADFLYVADIVFHFRTGYLEDGVLQTDAGKLRQHYMNSTTFYIDCLCLLPLDFLYLSIGFNSVLRGFRLVKIYRFWAFMDRTERHTNYPNLFRSCSLIHYLLVIFHWNGCLYHIVYKNNGFGSKNWVFGDHDSADVAKQYLQSYYWCTLALTTIGDLPRPRSKGEYMFVIGQLLFGLLLFATVLGHVANIVTSVSMARKEFQAKLDGVKTYMRMRRVPGSLQVKVIKWFDYLWLTQKCSDEERAVSCLPDKLKAEIAINVHLDTLKRVEIFQNTEAGFLCELVLRLRPVLFSPGDYICRKGEVGKEMYIVNRGRLQVVADNGNTVLATLKAGSYFGEISILNMGTAGNRRTASVRSVGYSDLFVLSKKDMWDVLKEYPAARVRLEAIAVKRLEKYKKAPLEKVALGRSQSTPGLVESRGRVPLEEMWISPVEPLVTSTTANSMFSPSHSPTARLMSRPLAARGSLPPHLRNVDSPSSANSSQPSSEGVAHLQAPTQATPGTTTSCNSMVPLVGQSRAESRSTSRAGSIVPSAPQQQDETREAELRAKIQQLQEQLARVQTENASLSAKLSQQRWEVDQRLLDIEMHICGASSGNSSAADDRESFI